MQTSAGPVNQQSCLKQSERVTMNQLPEELADKRPSPPSFSIRACPLVFDGCLSHEAQHSRSAWTIWHQSSPPSAADQELPHQTTLNNNNDMVSILVHHSLLIHSSRHPQTHKWLLFELLHSLASSEMENLSASSSSADSDMVTSNLAVLRANSSGFSAVS